MHLERSIWAGEMATTCQASAETRNAASTMKAINPFKSPLERCQSSTDSHLNENVPFLVFACSSVAISPHDANRLAVDLLVIQILFRILRCKDENY
jgi:hypothetical protein